MFPPRPRAHPYGCTRDALARVLAHYCASAIAPSERGRVSVLGWHIREDMTQGISVFFLGRRGRRPLPVLEG